jgi:hypothetical protein
LAIEPQEECGLRALVPGNLKAEELRHLNATSHRKNPDEHGSIDVTGEANQVGTSGSGWPDIAMDRLAI